MKLKTLILIFLLFNFVGNSQSIYSSWYCKEYQACFCIHKKGYSSINEIESIKFKQVKDKLKVTWVYNSMSIFNRQKIAWYKIEKLTKDSLVISSIKSIDILTESLLNNKMTFIKPKTNEDFHKICVSNSKNQN